ncbi:hypothetical protein [Domibacillus tundrae]|uniref:hypothetical protein n=1 Tax=Domibacillus tundrae TaxID=1587527 RepID=UPI000617EC19|nr:hypothetical protein [Domibacillus tundrae]
MEELFFVSIQEDVVFPEGEEVDELLSISLDPQVTIKDSVIQGSIEITGEYRINSISGIEEDSARQFFRHIPVQGVLPPDQRAAAAADIQIHTFDYKIEKPDRLILEAELAVAVSAIAIEHNEVAVMTATEEIDNETEEKIILGEIEENSSETEEETVDDETEEAAVQVQKRTEDDSSIFSWLEERPGQKAKWRFQVSSGNVELIATQDEELPQEE